MEQGKTLWTEERVNELVERMDQGFARMHAAIGEVRTDLANRMDGEGQSLGAKLDAQEASLFAKRDAQEASLFARLDDSIAARLELLRRRVMQFGIGTITFILLATAIAIALRA